MVQLAKTLRNLTSNKTRVCRKIKKNLVKMVLAVIKNLELRFQDFRIFAGLAKYFCHFKPCTEPYHPKLVSDFHSVLFRSNLIILLDTNLEVNITNIVFIWKDERMIWKDIYPYHS